MGEVGYVIVTMATNGIVHTYGQEDGSPFPDRIPASVSVRRMKRDETAMYGEATTTYKVCKILGKPE